MTLIDAINAFVGIVAALVLTAGLSHWQDRPRKPFDPWSK